MLGKLGDKSQSYCAAYKTHAMITCHGGTGPTDEDRDFDTHIEDTGGIDKSPDNDNENTNSSDTMLAFGGSEEDGHLSDLLYNSKANLTVLTREINSL